MESSEPRRVLIALAPAAVVEIGASLDDERLVVCAMVETAEAAIQTADREKPDVCVVDVDLPGSGLSAAAGIRRVHPAAGILLLGRSDEGGDLLDAVLAGARGYAVKPCDPDRLLAEVSRLLSGELAITDEHVLELLHELEDREWRRRRRERMRQILTERELEVLELLSRGRTTRQIAESCHVAPVTVRSHVAAIVRKLGVGDREAAVDAYEGGLTAHGGHPTHPVR